MMALATVVGLCLTFMYSKDTKFLMPGPLASGHSAIENCNSCHSKTGSSSLGWLHGIIAGDRRADSNACLTCHKMPEAAFNAHGVSTDALAQSTERLSKVAPLTPPPFSARVQGVALPTHGIVARGLYCSTCHQEHQGNNFDIKKISNEQCNSCHVVKVDSFDGGHPQFERYPFKRRTKIIFDHAEHFGRHFPEVAKKDAGKRAPDACSSCHTSSVDKRFMAVRPFEETCSGCHLDQITGKVRASGPKGIAFLSLPGLDLQTLKRKNALIGEWPSDSEAELTPFLKLMISRSARGRALVKTVEALNLQDLSTASDDQIKSVTDLAWEIKRLFHALISRKASDVLGDLGLDSGMKRSADIAANLVASMPRDVIVGAHQQWLPNLDTEMASRRASEQERDDWITTITQTGPISDAKSRASTADLGALNQSDRAATKGASGAATAEATTTVPFAAGKSDTASGKTDGGKAVLTTKERPASKAADQTDDLLFPTPEELRGGAAPGKGADKVASSRDAPGKVGAPVASDAVEVRPRARTAPAISIKSNVDAESWAEYGGWYRQDYTIFYRPAGHKDAFIYNWLLLTGLQAPRGGRSPAASIFDYLAGKEAQGACTKCHSVDDLPAKRRIVNFSPSSLEGNQRRFTQFIHEPHFGVMDSRGCLTCHSIEKDRPYLKSYEHGNPQSFSSNFGAVKKELCQTCHTSSKARQDCLLCHTYHVGGVTTPIIGTKVPAE